MAKAIKLLDIIKNCSELFGMPITEAFDILEIFNRGTIFEHYVDPRTYRNEDNIYVIKPITENSLYFCYVCPWCQDIHIESKRELFTDQRKLFVKCSHLKHLKLTFIIDMPVARIAINDDVIKGRAYRKGLTDEYNFMQRFEGEKEVDYTD